MKNFVIVAVLLLGSIGLVWFIMGDNSTSTDSTITLGEDAELDMSEESDTPIVTADSVATVNGEEISNADFTAQQTQILTAQGVDPATLDGETQLAIQNQALDSLISQELLKQAALAAGVEVSEAEIDAQLDIIKSQFEDEVVYEQTLAAQGLTEAELRTQLAAELSVGPYLEQAIDTASITVTQEEIDEAYANAAMQQDLPPLEQVRDQVEQLVLQEKQQPLIDQHIAMLQEVADIEKFI